MISQALSILSATLVLQGAAQTAVTLDRTYKAGDVDKYTIDAKVTGQGQSGSASGEITFKTLEVQKDGLGLVEMSAANLKMVMGGNEQNAQPEAIKVKFSKNSLPATLDTNGEKWVYALVSFSGYAPGGTQVGKEFKIEWKSSDGAMTVTGTGSVSEIATVAGAKVAVVKTKLKVVPGEDSPGELEITAKLALDTGKLISAEGKLNIANDDMAATFTISKAKG